MKHLLVNLALLCILGGCGDGRNSSVEVSATTQALSTSDTDAEAGRRLEETDERLEALAKRLEQLPRTEDALSVVRAHQARVRKAQTDRR